MATAGEQHSAHPQLATTLVLPLAAVAMALVAIFGEGVSFGAPTVAGALAGLVPWALIAGGVRLPLVAFALATLLSGAVVVCGDSNPGGMFPLLIAVVFVAKSTDDLRLVGGMVAGSYATIIVLTIAEQSADETGAIYFLGGAGISLLSGRMLRRQERLVEELQEMQQLHVEHAAAEERTRIAREIHDVVAHSLTVVMLHVTGARRVLGSDPVRAGEALARAESVGRDSLDSIRKVVGLLRAGEGVTPGTDQPQPGLASLDELVSGYRAGGLDVSVDVRLGGAALEPATELVVYRVVQESLSNVIQHAPGALSAVTIAAVGEPARRDVEVEVLNGPARATPSPQPGAAVRSGLGVRGMCERVEAAGGTLRAGPDGEGWRVAATLPLRQPAVGWAGEHRTASPATP